MKKLLLGLALICTSAFCQEAVPRSYFGMNLQCCSINGTAKRRSAPWPAAQFGALRIWDADAYWFQVNTSPGVYDWKVIDSWLDKAQAHHQEVMYTFAGVPTWASGDKNDPACKLWNMPGSCHPPSDLREDGSGSNQTYKDFVTALANHAHGRIKYWEVWNEPHYHPYWHGTMAQIVRMTQDLRTIVKGIDPEAVIVSPGTGWLNEHPETGKPDFNPTIWTDQYLATGGAKYVDVVAVHAYLKGVCPTGAWDLDQIEVRTAPLREIMKKNGVSNLPLWSTEGSWGPATQKRKTCTSDPDMQVAYVGQYHIAMWAAGFKRVYWYAWNSWDIGTLASQEDFQPTPAGKAYGEIINWMVGATLRGCDKSKSQWKCTFTRADGSQYLAVWDVAQTCPNGNCTATPVKVDPAYVDYLDLAGGKTKIQNHTVPVGMKPIWLEAPASPTRK